MKKAVISNADKYENPVGRITSAGPGGWARSSRECPYCRTGMFVCREPGLAYTRTPPDGGTQLLSDQLPSDWQAFMCMDCDALFCSPTERSNQADSAVDPVVGTQHVTSTRDE